MTSTLTARTPSSRSVTQPYIVSGSTTSFFFSFQFSDQLKAYTLLEGKALPKETNTIPKHLFYVQVVFEEVNGVFLAAVRFLFKYSIHIF